MSYEKVENTFFEAFEGQYVRALITGPTKELVERAAYDFNIHSKCCYWKS